MGYQSLYRKYRPKVFDDVIGQDHITATLVNQIKAERISHAYLFTGSRGTGKTTCAKIFAKAVNCQSSQNGSPCGKCEVCISLDDPSNIDVLEIDAASNNKVDEIRELRERVQYPPVKGKFKAFIIDEVHMLTDSAFNALLKTLEEPPPYAMFILATTEVHKLPATILSRCLRFDFRLVPLKLLIEHVSRIYELENKKAEPDAIRLIAEAGEGSVRDALSIADMCLNYSDGCLKATEVLNVLGVSDRQKIASLFDLIAKSDSGNALLAVNEQASLGKSMTLLAKELTRYGRDLLALKTSSDVLVTDAKENIERMRAAAEGYSVDLLVTLIQTFAAVDQDLRYSTSPKIILETAVVRAARLNSSDILSFSERVRRLEERLENSALQTAVPKSAKSAEDEKTPLPQNPVASSQTEHKINAKTLWGQLVTHFRTVGNMGAFTLLGGHTDFCIEDSDLIVYAVDEAYLRFCEPQMLDSLATAISDLGFNFGVKVQKRSDHVDMDDEITKLKKLIGNTPINIIK